MQDDQKNIEQVKQKYEMELLKIDGVEGVGIGEENGQEAIVLYISKDPYKMDQLPKQLEGYPLIFKQTEQFQAF